MFPLLELGSISAPLATLLLLAGLWLAFLAAERTAPGYRIAPEQVYRLGGVALFAGASAARLGFAARFLDSYLGNPAAIFALNANTLDVITGLLAASLAALLVMLWQHLPLRRTLDSLAPGLALLAVALGIGHLASGDAFGAPTRVPWAVELWDARRHPSQLYGSPAALAIFLSIWRLRRRNPFPGFLFSVWLALTAASRLFLEAYRGDSIVVAGSLREAQLAALLVLVIALWLMGRWARLPLCDSPAPE